jgi:alkaline phosphatase
MHDDVPVVQQEPAGVHRTFVVMGQDTILFQAELDLFQDGAELADAFAGADYKIIGKTANAADIQQDDVAGLFIDGYLDGATAYLDGFQSASLQSRFLHIHYTTGR